jgi:hypothetical protein
MTTYFYEHMCTYSISINTFEGVSRLDFEIHKVNHQEHLTIDGTSPLTKKN